MRGRSPPSSASRVQGVPELWTPGMAGPLEDLVARIHRRIEAFASEHGLEQAMVEVELADGALLRLESLSARARLRLPDARSARGRCTGVDRPDRGDPSVHAESGRAREPDRILSAERMSAGASASATMSNQT